MLILIIILVLVLGGGGGYYGHSRWGCGGGAGVGLGTILLILLVAYILGDFHSGAVHLTRLAYRLPKLGSCTKPGRLADFDGIMAVAAGRPFGSHLDSWITPLFCGRAE